MKVSIIIPVVRTDKAERCIAAIEETAGIPKSDYEIRTEVDTEGIGCPAMVKKLVEEARYDLVCFLGDDTVPHEGFLKNAIKAMKSIPGGIGVVGLNDNPKKSVSCCHWLAHKGMLPDLGGEFFHTGYNHCFCDDELQIRAMEMGKFVYAYDAILFHDHPSIHDDSKTDEHYDRVYDKEAFSLDKMLFEKRMNNGWKDDENAKSEQPFVAVAMPSNDTICTLTARSLVSLMTASARMGFRLGIIMAQCSTIEHGRNQAVEGAMKMGASHLLFLDSDMTFPYNALERLYSHHKPIVGCDASRRRPPYGPVLRKANGKKFNYKKGGLRKAQHLGMAVTLIDMKVFEGMEKPYFTTSYPDGVFVSEDVYFCNALRDQGHALYCDVDLSLEIGHIGSHEHKIKP